MVKVLIGVIISSFTDILKNPSLYGLLLALVLSAIWLISFWPPILKRPWTWAVLVGSTFLALIPYAIIRYPARFMVGALVQSVDKIMIAGFIIALVSGLVEVGFKLIPVVAYRRSIGKPVDPKLGLAVGAVAGVGFGFLVCMAALNQAYVSHTFNFAGIWREFLFAALSVSTMAIAGYGVFKARGWGFWALASVLFAITICYPYLILMVSSVLALALLSVWALAVTGIALWLRWRKTT